MELNITTEMMQDLYTLYQVRLRKYRIKKQKTSSDKQNLIHLYGKFDVLCSEMKRLGIKQNINFTGRRGEYGT